MPSNVVTSKAKRPKNAWYIISTKVGQTYELSLGYKSSRGESGPYSPSAQSLSVKVAFGPPTKCEYNTRKDPDGQTVKEFKFTNPKRETAGFDEVLFNSLEAGVNPFSQRLTSLFVEDKKELLANYLTAAQSSKNFVHSDEEHDDDGLCLSRKGVTLDMVVSNGGSLSELRYFIQVTEENATFGDTTQAAFAEVLKSCENKKKRKTDPVGTKSSKKASIASNEKMELEDPEGLEKKYQSTYMGVVWIPLDNISISKELNIKPNIFRVCRIKQSLKLKYDPSQSVIVVAPEDDVEELDVKNCRQKYVVVQKVHTLCAFKDLDNVGEFVKLTGHSHRKVLSFVVNTRSIPLLRYGNLRANDIASKFARKLYPQDLLHVFETLSDKDKSVNSLKVIERMSKLGRVGPNEGTALRKLCKWKQPVFGSLMKVIKNYELYETLDVKSSGNAGNISRGEKLCMPNVVFNNLAKMEEDYFEANFHKIIDKKISLRNLVDECLRMKEIEKVYGVLIQISGYQSVDSLQKEFPGKFEVDVVEKFTGSEIIGDKRNLQAILLEDYYQGITRQGLGLDCIPIKFESIKCLDDINVSSVGDQYDLVVFNMKETGKNHCASIIKTIIGSERKVHAGLFIFPNEPMFFEVISFLRAQNTTLIKDFKIIPVFFNTDTALTVDGVEENIKHGILFGKICILNPPLKVYSGHVKMIQEVLAKVAPPQSTVAVITEPGLSVVQVHSVNLLFKSVVYIGSAEEISKLRKILDKDKHLFSREKVGDDVSNNDNSSDEDSSDEDPGDKVPSDESSTSPAKESTSQGKGALENNEASTSSPYKFSEETETCLDDSGFENSTCELKVVRCLNKAVGFSESLDKIAEDIV